MLLPICRMKRRLHGCYRMKIDHFLMLLLFIKWADPADQQNLVPILDNPPTVTDRFD